MQIQDVAVAKVCLFSTYIIVFVGNASNLIHCSHAIPVLGAAVGWDGLLGRVTGILPITLGWAESGWTQLG